MKQTLLLSILGLLLSSSLASAQAPQKIAYQAVARNAAGTVLPNQTVKLRFSVRNASSNGTIVYQETQTATTSNIGLFNVNIGEGTVSAGIFAGIDWSNGAMFMQVELDPQGGNAFIDMGTQQMLSVPYALYAGNGFGSVSNIGDTLFLGNGNYIIIPGIIAVNNGGGGASINALTCASATNSGTLTSGTAANGVSSAVPYTGGNGGTHNGQTVASTGVTGLTATLAAGTFASGSGSLTYTISGAPASNGTAGFALSIGGQTCILSLTVNAGPSGQYPVGSVFCNGPSAIVDVTSPATGKIWMDRNLGATQAATSSTDANSYGDLYQWGRRSDGHQCRTSPTTGTLSGVDQPTHGNFILAQNSPYDWRSPQNVNLWQGVNGVNNPCPSGYRLPTNAELNAELSSWSSNNIIGAFASPLKLPVAGYRVASFSTLNPGGVYWSSTVNGVGARSLNFHSSIADMLSNYRADGCSVRCIKD
jgi:uncharacterized protein (TIGR02145 family)